MRDARENSLLEFALLGLVEQKKSCSGYDIRKVFTQTPMGTFSNSPGAIYPALKRLERRGLILGRVEEAGGLRRRKVYRIGAKGRAALEAWVNKPVDVVRGMQEVSLRFAFMEGIAGKEGCIRFLESLAGELEKYLPNLQRHLKAFGGKMPLSARLALQSGIMGYEASLAWAKLALVEYRRN